VQTVVAAVKDIGLLEIAIFVRGKGAAPIQRSPPKRSWFDPYPPCKVEFTAVEESMGQKTFFLRFLQCRDAAWVGRLSFAKYDLKPQPGMEQPQEIG